MKTFLKRALKPLKPLERHAPVFLQQWGGLLADLQIDPSPFTGFSDAIRPSMMRIAATRFYRYDEHRAEKTRIRGWLTPKERQILYACGRWLSGPMTEIGSWCGLSTTAIARGIKDSGEAKPFKTYDLVLQEDYFRPTQGGIGMFLPGDKVSRGICSEESYLTEIRPVITAPGGSKNVLTRNLAARGLLGQVEILTGDFREQAPVESKFIFCDCLHDEYEIETNTQPLRAWLRPGSILACHDLGRIPALITALRKKLPLGHAVAVDSIYLAEVCFPDACQPPSEG